MSAKKKPVRKITPAKPKRARAKKVKRPARGGRGGQPFDASWHEPFLDFLRKLPVPTMACRALKISRQTYYEHLQKDGAFAQAVEAATPEGVDTVEGIAFQLATIGRPRKKFFQGEPIMDPETGEQYVEHEIDSTLIQFILKNRKPEVYGDKSKVELSGSVELSDDEVVKRGREAQAGIIAALQASLKGTA